MTHSRLAPSSASRRVACPGSRSLEEKYPQPPDAAHTLEGNLAHWVASEFLRKGSLQITDAPPNNELITDEMIEGAQLYSDAINKVLIAAYGKADTDKLHIEERINIQNIHPDCWGTPDCWLFNDTGEVPVLHIWDYKFGHKYVDAFENWQLIEYAAGILAPYASALYDIKVELCIVQPRNFNRWGPVRTWSMSLNRLQSYFNKLVETERAASLTMAPCFPSPECQYCSARAMCKTLQNAAATITDVSLFNIPFELDNNQLGTELRYLQRAQELLEARITGISEIVTYKLRMGESIPHYRLEQGYGREKWKTPVNEVIVLGQMLGINLKKPDEVVTPRQAVKLGLDEDMVTKFSEKPFGQMKLIPVNAARIFGATK